MKIHQIFNYLAPFVLIALLMCTSCSQRLNQAKADEVMQADIAFSELSVREGRNHSFLSYCAEDGVLLRENSLPIEGKGKIQELLKTPDSSYTLTWKPSYGFVARSGDLGYTYGIWELMIKATGEKSHGTYATVWKKNRKGDWQWALDTGNEGLGK